MKKICYFINSDWYFDLHWLERACAAQRYGYQIHVITRFEGDTFQNKFKNLGFICHPICLKERSLNPFELLNIFLKIFFVIKKIKPSIIHSITIKPIIIGGVISRLLKMPFVANIVGLGRVFDSDGIIYQVIRKLVVFIYILIFKNKKSKIIFEHEKDKTILSRVINFESGQAHVIDGAGVDTEIFVYQEEKLLARPIVFFAARMLKNKGLKTLIDIKSELKEKNIFFDLIVAGIEVPDDPQAIPSSQLIAWHKQKDITWLGTRRDMAQLIANSSIVALPTVYPEGVPRILIEASAIGRPCIAYNSGGCNSIIYDGITGYLVDKNNKEEFIKKLVSLLNQPKLRREMGINGRKLVIEKFSSDTIINSTLKIYEDICL